MVRPKHSRSDKADNSNKRHLYCTGYQWINNHIGRSKSDRKVETSNKPISAWNGAIVIRAATLNLLIENPTSTRLGSLFLERDISLLVFLIASTSIVLYLCNVVNENWRVSGTVRQKATDFTPPSASLNYRRSTWRAGRTVPPENGGISPVRFHLTGSTIARSNSESWQNGYCTGLENRRA